MGRVFNGFSEKIRCSPPVRVHKNYITIFLKMKGANFMSNNANAIINTNSANLSNAITVYNDGLKSGASMETMKTYNSAAKSAVEAITEPVPVRFKSCIAVLCINQEISYLSASARIFSA